MRIARGQVIVSNDDLEELLSCAWITRIWTYQEVVLASKPVLVSGVCHSSWSRFTHALRFLATITELPSMAPWMNIIDTRGWPHTLAKSNLGKPSQTQSQIARTICIWQAASIVGWILLAIALSLFAVLVSDLSYERTWKLYAYPAPGVALLLACLILLLPPNPGLPFACWTRSFNSHICLDAKAYSTIYVGVTLQIRKTCFTEFCRCSSADGVIRIRFP